MNKTNIHTSILTHPADVRFDPSIRQFNLKASSRLLVLVPVNFDYTTVTQRICELARATDSSIELLGLCNNAEHEMALRRDLITMSTLIRGARILASVTVETGADWVAVVKNMYQPGDMIVCMAGQRAGFLKRPLSQILESTLQAPIYILSELPSSKRQPLSIGLVQVIAWMGSLIIIAGFLTLQIKLQQSANHWTTIMELLSTAVEFWLIWAWNNLFG